MTDITQVTEALDLLTTKHTAEMEVKADQAAVNEAVEAVKAEAVESAAAVQVELEAAKAVSAELIIKHEELEAKFAAMPTITKKDTPTMSNLFEKMTDANGNVKMGQSIDTFAKAINEGESITGGRVDSNAPWYALTQQSIFRQHAHVIATTAGLVKLPSMDGVVWENEDTVLQDGSRNNSGSIASIDVIVKNWTTQTPVSLATIEDLQETDSSLTGQILDRLAQLENVQGAATLKAATGGATPTVAKVSTGAAAGLPTAANLVGKMNAMVATISSAYLPNAKFFVSRGLMAALQSSNNTTLNYDASTRVTTFAGYPVVTVDALDDGKTGTDVSGYFGDMGRALAFVARKEVVVNRFDQTSPGSMVYYSNARFSFSTYNPAAITALVTEA